MIEGLARAMILEGRDTGPDIDQTTLTKVLWPVAKYDVVSLNNES